MAYIILKDKWRFQPQFSATLDPYWGVTNVLTPYQRHSIYVSASGVVSRSAGIGGLGFKTTSAAASAAAVQIPNFVDIAGKSELSALVYWIVPGDSTGTPILAETAGSYWRFGFWTSGTKFRSRDTSTGDTGTGEDLTLSAGTTGAAEVRIGTYSVGQSLKAGYINGVLNASTTTSVNAMTTTASTHIGISSQEANNYSNTTPIFLVAIAERAWSEAEAKALSENPWQIFIPVRHRIYVPSAAAATNVTTGVGALSITGYAPTVTIPSVNVSAATGALALTGNAPAVTSQINVAPSTGIISVTGRAPTVSLPWWQAFSLTINTGSIVSGTVPDTYTQNDTRLVLAETTGTPGFSYDFTFENVPENGAKSINFEGYYSGNLVHNVKIQQYNYTTTNWVNLNPNTTDIPDGTSDVDLHFSLLGYSSPWWSNGQIKLRIVHTSAGNPTHQLLIDEFVLNPEITVNAGETTLSLSGQAPTATAIDYDYLNASADVTDGSWVKSTDGTNTDLYTMLDEATIDDSDYIKTSTLDDECEIRLEAGSTPSISGYLNLQIKIPSGFSPTGTLTVTLVDNTTQVQQWASQSVSAGQLLDLAVTETISSYSNLRVRLKATA